MDARSAQAMLEPLQAAVDAARDVAARDTAWEQPAPDAPAGRERAAEEARRPAPRTGSWPWAGAGLTARSALWVMIEEARALPALVEPGATSYAADAVCRSVLETGALAWWLLDPDIGAARRTARFLLYRLQGAEENRKAIGAALLTPDENPSEYGETVEDVLREVSELRWSVPETKTGKQILNRLVLNGHEERWPGYTERAADLVTNIWPQGGLPYRLLSGVVHAGLNGLNRNLAVSPHGRLGLRPDPGGAVIWLWQDVYLATGALMLTAGRAVSFLGLHEHGARQPNLLGDLQRTLVALRPTVP